MCVNACECACVRVTRSISLDRRDVLAGFTDHCDELPNVNISREDMSWPIVSNVCVHGDLAHEFEHNIMVAEAHDRGTSSPYGNKKRLKQEGAKDQVYLPKSPLMTCFLMS